MSYYCIIYYIKTYCIFNARTSNFVMKQYYYFEYIGNVPFESFELPNGRTLILLYKYLPLTNRNLVKIQKHPCKHDGCLPWRIIGLDLD